jgi:hypothetical protein
LGAAEENDVADWVDSKTIGGVTEVTLLTPIKQGIIPGETRNYEQRLNDELANLCARVVGGIPNPIMQVPTIHFGRWLIVVPAQYLSCDMEWVNPLHTFRSWLLFMSEFDGDMKTYLDDFSSILGDDVDRIWGNCEGYPSEGARDLDAFWAYAKRYQLTTQAFYNAYPGVSVPRVHELVRFRQLFDDFVAATRKQDGTSIDNLPAEFDRFLDEALSFPQNFPARGGVYEITTPFQPSPPRIVRQD